MVITLPFLAGLPTRLRNFYVANTLAIALSVLGLLIGELFLHSWHLDLSLLTVAAALAISVLALPLIRRGGVQIAVLALTLSSAVFAFAGVVVNPFVAPMAVLVLLVPLLLAFPYLPARAVSLGVGFAVVSTAAVAALAEWRRDSEPGPSTPTEVVVLLLFTPLIAAVLTYEVHALYREMKHQAEALVRSRTQVGDVAIAARKSLERDLHDGAQQRLIGLTVQSRLARNALAKGDLGDVDEILARLAAESQAAVQELRDLAQGIYPPLLTERGLGPALKAIALRTPIPCVLFVEKLPRYAPTLEAAIYFCIHEALQNAIKHSDATEITIQIRGVPALEFAVIDNGRGFDASRNREHGGLSGLVVRLDAMGGELTVTSRPGGGTTVRAVIPDLQAVSDR